MGISFSRLLFIVLVIEIVTTPFAYAVEDIDTAIKDVQELMRPNLKEKKLSKAM